MNFRKPGNLILVFWKDSLESFFHASNIPLKYRIWAVLHGFNPENAWFKGINNVNKTNYLKDLTYYSHTPYNNPNYIHMVSKDRFKETLKAYPEYLPKYYGKIKSRKIELLDDCKKQNALNRETSIIKLLENKKVLALKRISGRAGAGFIVGRYHSKDQFTFNDIPYDRRAAEQYISSLDGYIVSEFIKQCSQYDNIWSKTTHTLRIQTCNVMNGKAEAVFAFLRFGSSKALHAVSHVIDKGIYTAIIDVSSGQTNMVLTPDELGRAKQVTVHPDTGANLLIPVPHWDTVVAKCIEMHDKNLAKLAWLGWDIVITDDGFRILEINTFSGLIGVEAVEPIYKSNRLESIFNKLIYCK